MSQEKKTAVFKIKTVAKKEVLVADFKPLLPKFSVCLVFAAFSSIRDRYIYTYFRSDSAPLSQRNTHVAARLTQIWRQDFLTYKS